MATQIKNLGFEVDMDEDGNFIFSKPPPEPKELPKGKDDKPLETDPYAGTDIDASQLGQMQEEQFSRNKPSMSVGPPNRNTGLPKEAANNNVDRRTERRVG